MDYQRRFIFRGCAAAFGGHIIRPKDLVLEAAGASALPVSGGRSVARLSKTTFDELFQIGGASTSAEGLFEDRGQFLAWTNHRVAEDALVAVTHAAADVEQLVVGRKPRLSIARLRAELHARSPLASGEPSIRVGDGTTIAGVDIDGHKLLVRLDLAPFQRFDTRARLLAAVDDPAFVKASGGALFLTTSVNGEAAPPSGRLVERHGTIFATIVTAITWDGAPFPGAVIDHNMVVVPDFGRIFFGELLVSSDSRRLTMVRCALGSETGGTACAADVQDNGMWS